MSEATTGTLPTKPRHRHSPGRKCDLNRLRKAQGGVRADFRWQTGPHEAAPRKRTDATARGGDSVASGQTDVCRDSEIEISRSDACRLKKSRKRVPSCRWRSFDGSRYRSENCCGPDRSRAAGHSTPTGPGRPRLRPLPCPEDETSFGSSANDGTTQPVGALSACMTMVLRRIMAMRPCKSDSRQFSEGAFIWPVPFR